MRVVFGDFNGMQSAVENELCRLGGRCEFFELDAAEGCHLRNFCVVSGEADADIERAFEMKLDGSADLVKGLAVIGKEHGEGVAALFKADTFWRIDVEPGALGVGVLVAAVLQGGHA